MQSSLVPEVAAANDLTRRWTEIAGSGNFVLSGCGVWPLLALLAPTATGPARTELATAAGVPADAGHQACLSLLERIRRSESIRTALGLWAPPQTPLIEEWVRSLPPGTVGALNQRTELDEWAALHTDGLIDRFPVHIDQSTALALATAVVARTSWTERFHADVLEPASGPWRGHRGPALSRNGRPGRASVLTGEEPVTKTVVAGNNDLDVHLLLGPDSATPAQVLAAGFGALDGSIGAVPVASVGPAPGTSVREVRALSDFLRIQLPPFDIRSDHDLLPDAELFGLPAAATPTRTGHFPGLSTRPLYLSAAGQNVRARFTAEGFDAAAVSAFAMNVGSVPVARPSRPSLCVEIVFDRPFGFLGVHRDTGMVVVAGWVATPAA
ncbi:MAG: hypothetical protein J2P18_09730 [Nocardia sp.]|nr:hypothetical protein [Nocardia sp.]